MAIPDTIPIGQLGQPFYTGSVQRLYAIAGHDSHMVTETTSAGSVFDVGSIFDIPGSDVSRAVFRHSLYSRMGTPELWQAVAGSIAEAAEIDADFRQMLGSGLLEELCVRGAGTHHGGMIDAQSGQVVSEGIPQHPSRFNVVRRYQILKPVMVDVLGASLFDYSRFPAEDGFVVPLEYIVRFGITGASSILRKYRAMNEGERKSYEAEMGVSQPLKAWQMLDRPIGDCTTKFEPEDRNLTKQEALATCGLTGDRFSRSLKLAVLGAWAVRHLLAEAGLRLWDIKWEFAKDGEDLVFVDTIDTDSFRATRFFEHGGRRVVVHFNKQSMRDFYRIMHGDWLAGVNAAKSRAKTEGAAFTELLAAGQKDGTYPPTPTVPDEFLAIQTQKMEVIQAYMLGRQNAAETEENLENAGRREIDFYAAAGKIAQFAEINGCPPC